MFTHHLLLSSHWKQFPSEVLEEWAFVKYVFIFIGLLARGDARFRASWSMSLFSLGRLQNNV